MVLCSYPQAPAPRTDHKHVLEHSLHQLLREVHHKTLHLAPPHPVTATFGVSKRRRLAGPTAMSRADLKEMVERLIVFEGIVFIYLLLVNYIDILYPNLKCSN